MNVSEALTARSSIRAFLDKPVSDELIAELLTKAARAPSGGNLQPWRIFVINRDATARFLEHIETKDLEAPPYEIYPPNLKEPYRSSRFKLGEDMYALLGIPREDKTARLMRMADNYKFFGAPAGLFCYIDKIMGLPQWADLGMFLQSFMLAAEEAGLSTCAQEAWVLHAEAVRDFVGAADELAFFCGMAIGYKDPEAEVNRLVSQREPLEAWAKFV